jgi:hypothetical protein
VAEKGSLLTRALEKAGLLTSIRIEVLVSRQPKDSAAGATLDRLLGSGLLKRTQIVIYANPVTHRAALWWGPELSRKGLSDSDLRLWLEGLEEDLHQTHVDRALALAVISLGIVLGGLPQGRLPRAPTNDEKRDGRA